MNQLIENNSNSRKGIIILITTQIAFILLYIQYTYEKKIRNENINFSSEKKGIYHFSILLIQKKII